MTIGWFGWRNRNMIPILGNEEEIDRQLDIIKANLMTKDETITLLREELAKVKDKAFAETEMEKLKQENERIRKDSYRGFPISEKESEAIKNWKEKHEVEKHGLITQSLRLKAQGVSGGRYTYSFVPTSIGTSGVIRCCCGECFEFQFVG